VRWGRGREDKNLVIDGGVCGGAGATTVDITEPDRRLIKTGAIDEKEIADCLKPS
jgi:L-threonylcarbamoyladenylate synthase